MEQKYRLTDETLKHKGRTLYRIEALRDFWDVKVGDKGGWIESEDNLSQEGMCWVFDEAKAYGEARVYGNANIHDSAVISGHAIVFGGAEIYGNAEVFGDANVFDDAKVFDRAGVGCSAIVFEHAEVYGSAYIGDARIYGLPMYLEIPL